MIDALSQFRDAIRATGQGGIISDDATVQLRTKAISSHKKRAAP